MWWDPNAPAPLPFQPCKARQAVWCATSGLPRPQPHPCQLSSVFHHHGLAIIAHLALLLTKTGVVWCVETRTSTLVCNLSLTLTLIATLTLNLTLTLTANPFTDP